MPLRILIAPDKFKGTLSAPEAAKAIARGWRFARPEDALELLPITDGGDGFGEAVRKVTRARPQKVQTVDAAHRPCTATWWWEPRTRTAIIESAKVIGLAMLPPGKFHPFELDTFGLGAVIQAAARKGAHECLLGIGGSATNDGGFGLARSVGWSFFDRAGAELNTWTSLDTVAEARAPQHKLRLPKLVVAVDVRNPLLGAQGASRVYGPQKGLRDRDFEKAEACLAGLAKVARRALGSDDSRTPGAGAAGGLGFGLAAFLRARLTPGFALFAKMSRLREHLGACDCVVTGEGRIDGSTLMGKGVSELARRCLAARKPCLAVAGTVAANPRQLRLFSATCALTDLTLMRNAKEQPALWLERLAERTARECSPKLESSESKRAALNLKSGARPPGRSR